MSNPAAVKTVQFDSLTIREYPIEIGDNPACSSGAPIQIGWTPIQTSKKINIDLYETKRRREGRRKPKNLSLPAFKRAEKLFIAGYTLDDVVRVTLEVQEAKRLRAETLQAHGWERFSMFISRTGKLPKGLLKGGSTGSLRRVQTSSSLLSGASAKLKRATSIPHNLIESTGRGIRKVLPRQRTSHAIVA